MSTKKPRITISLEPRLYETLSRMSKASGDSISSIIGEFLGSIHDPLMRTVALLEAAQDAPEEIKRGLRATAEEIEHGLGDVLGDARLQLDLLLGDHLDKRQAGEIHEASTGLLGVVEVAKDMLSGGGDPHIVTRGSGLPGRKENSSLGGDTKRVRNAQKRTRKE